MRYRDTETGRWTYRDPEGGTVTVAYVGTAAVNVVNRPEQLRNYWTTPSARTLRKLAERAARDEGRTLKRGWRRMPLQFRSPLYVGYTYLLEGIER